MWLYHDHHHHDLERIRAPHIKRKKPKQIDQQLVVKTESWEYDNSLPGTSMRRPHLKLEVDPS